MPELPEVETVRRGLAPVMEGRVIARLDLRRGDLRFPFPGGFVDHLEGETITAIGRRAKYLLMHLASERTVIMHLGMSGSFRTESNEAVHSPGEFHHERSRLVAHDHVVFHLDDGARVIYNDPRRFGFMLLHPTGDLGNHPAFATMGVEPLGNAMHSGELAARMAGKSTPLKAALLDQRVVAGLGNIYVCEALWRARLSPRRKASTLVRKNGSPTARLEQLTVHIRDVLREAIVAGGSSLRDHAATDGSLGYFQHRFSAYDREGQPCPNGCGKQIKRIVQSGRSTFFCSACQS